MNFTCISGGYHAKNNRDNRCARPVRRDDFDARVRTVNRVETDIWCDSDRNSIGKEALRWRDVWRIGGQKYVFWCDGDRISNEKETVLRRLGLKPARTRRIQGRPNEVTGLD